MNNRSKQVAKLIIVVPCFNEADVLPKTHSIFWDVLLDLINEKSVSSDSHILFVDDGSTDDTWNIIEKVSDNKHIKGISLSRNMGHQNALLAGMMEAKDRSDIVISIDCDGQDDVSIMKKMIAEYYSGAEIVYGVRGNRKTDSFFKRNSAETFYKAMKLLGGEIIYNHADFRLVSSKALNALAEFNEVNIFLRGMMPLVGFHSTCVYYERKERMAGRSKYPLKSMIAFALEGITSFSIRPLRLISFLGGGVSFISFIAILWSLFGYLKGSTVAGWTSMTCIISLIGGIQLICMGVIGEYIGKIYLETKKRPRFIVDRRTYDKDLVEENKK